MSTEQQHTCTSCTLCAQREEHLQNEDPRHLIPSLCEDFYVKQWVTGTGGSISIKHDNKYYITPSGVRKERILSQDLFVLDDKQQILSQPTNPSYTQSQCTPLFFNAYDLYHAGAVIHTHSIHAVMVTMLIKGNEWRITHQEMIKGLRIGDTQDSYRYYDEIVVPIIENTAEEKDLKDRMEAAMKKYPNANAVLVRRHGIYVWGPTWQKAKGMCECYDYLLELTVKLYSMGLQSLVTDMPEDSEYKDVPRITGP